jgi:hypothetical protein
MTAAFAVWFISLCIFGWRHKRDDLAPFLCG